MEQFVSSGLAIDVVLAVLAVVACLRFGLLQFQLFQTWVRQSKWFGLFLIASCSPALGQGTFDGILDHGDALYWEACKANRFSSAEPTPTFLGIFNPG